MNSNPNDTNNEQKDTLFNTFCLTFKKLLEEPKTTNFPVVGPNILWIIVIGTGMTVMSLSFIVTYVLTIPFKLFIRFPFHLYRVHRQIEPFSWSHAYNMCALDLYASTSLTMLISVPLYASGYFIWHTLKTTIPLVLSIGKSSVKEIESFYLNFKNYILQEIDYLNNGNQK